MTGHQTHVYRTPGGQVIEAVTTTVAKVKPLTNSKSDLPVTGSGFESARLTSRSHTQKSTAKPTERNPRPVNGASGAPFHKICQCGCSQSFAPRDHRQKFLPGHRFHSYEMHSCPSCGIKHRVSKKGQTNA